MRETAVWLLIYSVKASLFGGAVLLLLAACRKASAALRSGMAVAGALGALMLPLTVSVLPPLPLPDWLAPRPPARVSLEGIVPLGGSAWRGLQGQPVESTVLANVLVTGTSPGRSSAGTWPYGVVGIWSAGLVVAVIVLGLRIRRTLRMVREARLLPQDHPLVLELRGVCRELRWSSVPEARLSRGTTVPFAWGLGRAAVILPGAFGQLTTAARRAVLLHECAHLERRDGPAQLIVSLCRCVQWFNPLFLALDRAFNAEAEKASDDFVIASGVPASDYADTILSYFQAAACGPVGGRRTGAATGYYPSPQLDRQLRGQKRTLLARIRRLVDPAARRSALGALLGWTLAGGSTATASVLGSLVLVPTYEWRYQLAERSLPFAGDLVACWHLDTVVPGGEAQEPPVTPDAAGTRDGKVMGALPEDEGRIASALWFDGRKDYVDMGDQFGDLTFPFTLMVWVRTSLGEGSQNVVWLGSGGFNEYVYLGLNEGRPALKSRYVESITITGKSPIADGAWHHLTGVFLSENHRLLYADGELVSEDHRPAKKPRTLYLQVGRNGRRGHATSHLAGTADDVRVYRAGLGADAIQEIMKGDFRIMAERGPVRGH